MSTPRFCFFTYLASGFDVLIFNFDDPFKIPTSPMYCLSVPTEFLPENTVNPSLSEGTFSINQLLIRDFNENTKLLIALTDTGHAFLWDIDHLTKPPLALIFYFYKFYKIQKKKNSRNSESTWGCDSEPTSGLLAFSTNESIVSIFEIYPILFKGWGIKFINPESIDEINSSEEKPPSSHRSDSNFRSEFPMFFNRLLSQFRSIRHQRRNVTNINSEPSPQRSTATRNSQVPPQPSSQNLPSDNISNPSIFILSDDDLIQTNSHHSSITDNATQNEQYDTFDSSYLSENNPDMLYSNNNSSLDDISHGHFTNPSLSPSSHSQSRNDSQSIINSDEIEFNNLGDSSSLHLPDDEFISDSASDGLSILHSSDSDSFFNQPMSHLPSDLQNSNPENIPHTSLSLLDYDGNMSGSFASPSSSFERYAQSTVDMPNWLNPEINPSIYQSDPSENYSIDSFYQSDLNSNSSLNSLDTNSSQGFQGLNSEYVVSDELENSNYSSLNDSAEIQNNNSNISFTNENTLQAQSSFDNIISNDNSNPATSQSGQSSRTLVRMLENLSQNYLERVNELENRNSIIDQSINMNSTTISSQENVDAAINLAQTPSIPYPVIYSDEWADVSDPSRLSGTIPSHIMHDLSNDNSEFSYSRHSENDLSQDNDYYDYLEGDISLNDDYIEDDFYGDEDDDGFISDSVNSDPLHFSVESLYNTNAELNSRSLSDPNEIDLELNSVHNSLDINFSDIFGSAYPANGTPFHRRLRRRLSHNTNSQYAINTLEEIVRSGIINSDNDSFDNLDDSDAYSISSIPETSNSNNIPNEKKHKVKQPIDPLLAIYSSKNHLYLINTENTSNPVVSCLERIVTRVDSRHDFELANFDRLSFIEVKKFLFKYYHFKVFVLNCAMTEEAENKFSLAQL
ncbi:hypothetical protein AYI69_g1191 [Smittium culicis]|uniref:Uncharacterized protein n=1 Tax=Smittium culicis TaxID=133412 RepID=A0A1R1YR24_9FUNG|nr:hypothetical protein AYI69_g1191 [Smittium culicis]